MAPDNSKKYIFKTAGTGQLPHILQNVDHPADSLYLCSCGGTKNADGMCDGSHNRKKDSACSCEFCQHKSEQVKTE